MTETFRLTKGERQTLRSALSHAIDERESLADAYSHTGDGNYALYMKQADKIRKLHAKLFGEKPLTDQFKDEMDAIPLVSIWPPQKGTTT